MKPRKARDRLHGTPPLGLRAFPGLDLRLFLTFRLTMPTVLKSPRAASAESGHAALGPRIAGLQTSAHLRQFQVSTSVQALQENNRYRTISSKPHQGCLTTV